MTLRAWGPGPTSFSPNSFTPKLVGGTATKPDGGGDLEPREGGGLAQGHSGPLRQRLFHVSQQRRLD